MKMNKTQARDIIRQFFYARVFCPPRSLDLARRILGNKEANKLERQAIKRRYLERLHP